MPLSTVFSSSIKETIPEDLLDQGKADDPDPQKNRRQPGGKLEQGCDGARNLYHQPAERQVGHADLQNVAALEFGVKGQGPGSGL